MLRIRETRLVNFIGLNRCINYFNLKKFGLFDSQSIEAGVKSPENGQRRRISDGREAARSGKSHDEGISPPREALANAQTDGSDRRSFARALQLLRYSRQ